MQPNKDLIRPLSLTNLDIIKTISQTGGVFKKRDLLEVPFKKHENNTKEEFYDKKIKELTIKMHTSPDDTTK
jgi:uncharacterized radical SAM superfamily Fe-S cluster-containing enzyme